MACLLVGAVGAGVGLARHHPPIAFAVVAVGGALAVRDGALRPLGAAFLAPLGLVLGLPWPSSILASLVVVRGPSLRRLVRTGTRSLRSGLAVGALASLPAYLLAQRQVTWSTLPLPEPPIGVVALGVVIVALLNASLEEMLWREHLFRSLDELAVRPGPALIAQAVSFALAHASGLPGGAVGMAGAGGLALALGLLRSSAAGLPGAIVAHATVDVTLFVVVAGRLVWTG